MKVVSLGPDGFALKIASSADHVASLTTEELYRKNVGGELLSIFQHYVQQLASMKGRAGLAEATASKSPEAEASTLS